MRSIHVSACVKMNNFGNHSYHPKVVTYTSINVFINIQYRRKLIVDLILISSSILLLKPIISYVSNNESFGIIIIILKQMIRRHTSVTSQFIARYVYAIIK